MGRSYSVLGLTIYSTLELPYLPLAPKESTPDLSIAGGEGKLACDDFFCVEERVYFSWWKHQSGRCLLRIKAGPSFEFSADYRSLIAWRDEAAADEVVLDYLTGLVLGFCCHLFQRTPLHGGAVGIGPGGALILGYSGCGKSTLVTALCQRGARFLTEDIAVLEVRAGVVRVERGPQVAKLRAGALPHLQIEEKVMAVAEKYHLPLVSMEAQAQPIHRLFILGERSEDYRRLEVLSPPETLLALQAHAYMSLFRWSERKQREFKFYSEVAQRLRAEVLHPPMHLRDYADFVDWLMGDLKKV